MPRGKPPREEGERGGAGAAKEGRGGAPRGKVIPRSPLLAGESFYLPRPQVLYIKDPKGLPENWRGLLLQNVSEEVSQRDGGVFLGIGRGLLNPGFVGAPPPVSPGTAAVSPTTAPVSPVATSVSPIAT